MFVFRQTYSDILRVELITCNHNLLPGAVKLVLWHHRMHEIQVHSVTPENQFHCTRLYISKIKVISTVHICVGFSFCTMHEQPPVLKATTSPLCCEVRMRFQVGSLQEKERFFDSEISCTTFTAFASTATCRKYSLHCRQRGATLFFHCASSIFNHIANAKAKMEL